MATITGSGQITIIDINDVTISSSAPTIPVRNQLWFDTSPLSANPVGPATLKMWDGTSWKAANITAQEYQDLLATVSGTTRYRGVNAPNGVFTCSSIGAATPTVNGQVEITLNWTYAQGTEKADGFTVIWESNAASGVAPPTAASTSITVDSYTTKQVLVLPRGKWYSFRLYAFRTTQNGIVPGSLALGSNWSNWTPSLTDISMLTPPAGSGLGQSDDRLGFYANGAWKTYMDKLGNFFLSGQSGTQSLTWNSATGSLDIVGSITLTNTLSADKLTEGSTNKVFNSSLQIGGRNYIKNASLEQFSSGFTGWILFSNVDVAVTTQAVDAPASIYGTKSAKFSIAAPAVSGAVNNLQWGQLVNTSSGKEYTVSFWAKSSVPMSNKIVSVHLTSSPWTNYGLSYSLNLTTTWQLFTKTFTANTSDTSARLNFQVGGAAGDVYIDNVKFEDGNKNTAFTLANEDIDTYGTTATWSSVSGTGRPADNATVGATWGVNLGSQPDSLSDINSTEGTKLTGVETGSTASSANLIADPSFARTTGIADLTYWTGIDNVNVQWSSTLGLGNASPGVKVFFAGAGTNRDVRTASTFPISQGQPIKIAVRLYISSDCTGIPTVYLRGEDAAAGNAEWVASSVSTTVKGSWITHTATLTPTLNTTVRARIVLSLNSATTGYVTWDRAYAGFAEEGSTLGASWGTNLQNIPTTLGTPSGSGLFLSSTNMGYYSGGVWKTYIDNNGNLKLGDDLTSFNTVGLKGLHWDQINGILKIRGQINASDIVTSSLTASRTIGVGGITIDSGNGTTTGSISLGKTSGTDLTNGHKGFWLGSNGASAQFLVGSDTQYFQWDGTNVTIRGPLNAGDIQSGGTITGSTLQTASSGKRFVVDRVNNEARFFNESDTLVASIGDYGYNGFNTDTTIIYSNSSVANLAAASFSKSVATSSAVNIDYGSVASQRYGSDAALIINSEKDGMFVHSLGGSNTRNAIRGIVEATGGPAIYGTNQTVQNIGISTACGIAGIGKVGVYGGSNATEGGAGSACFKAFAVNGAATYASFTGNHDALIDPNEIFDIGDIMCDAELIATYDISDTITRVETSSRVKQKNAIGVVTHAPLMIGDITSIPALREYGDIDYIINNFKFISVNALGEGMINVCKDGGNIEAGDFICSSMRSGKGMRQDSDMLYNYTVAKARESVIWAEDEDDIRMIACTYHCG